MSKRANMEAKIERIVELEYNQLDRRLTNNEITQDQYDEEARELDAWARNMYDELDLKETV